MAPLVGQVRFEAVGYLLTIVRVTPFATSGPRIGQNLARSLDCVDDFKDGVLFGARGVDWRREVVLPKRSALVQDQLAGIMNDKA